MKGICFDCKKVFDIELAEGWDENPTHNPKGYVVVEHTILNTRIMCDGSETEPDELIPEFGDYEEDIAGPEGDWLPERRDLFTDDDVHEEPYSSSDEKWERHRREIDRKRALDDEARGW